MNRKTFFIITCIFLILFTFFQLWTKDKLEFRTERLFDNYRNISYFTFILLVALLAILIPPPAQTSIDLIAVIIIGAAVILWVSDTTFPETKIKDDKAVLMINKFDTSKKIIQQVYYTGITWSNANYDTVLTSSITKNIRWTHRINLDSIDKAEWTLQK